MALWLLPIQTDQASNCYLGRLSALYDPRPFPDIADGLVGVGLITSSEDCPGVLTLDKGYNEMSKFLNRILGMHVEKQNLLFKYFSDTLAAIISQAKRSGRFVNLEKKQASCLIPQILCRYDQGILDVGMTKEDRVELVKTHCFTRKHATGKAKIELHVLQVGIIEQLNNRAKYDATVII